MGKKADSHGTEHLNWIAGFLVADLCLIEVETLRLRAYWRSLEEWHRAASGTQPLPLVGLQQTCYDESWRDLLGLYLFACAAKTSETTTVYAGAIQV
jgi:hypothetical protein